MGIIYLFHSISVKQRVSNAVVIARHEPDLFIYRGAIDDLDEVTYQVLFLIISNVDVILVCLRVCQLAINLWVIFIYLVVCMLVNERLTTFISNKTSKEIIKQNEVLLMDGPF